jgi:hypothetical protein
MIKPVALAPAMDVRVFAGNFKPGFARKDTDVTTNAYCFSALSSEYVSAAAAATSVTINAAIIAVSMSNHLLPMGSFRACENSLYISGY